MNVFICVEIPKHSHQKYEFDEKLDVIKLDRTLFSPVYFPFEYGFINDTAGEDGDPLDAVLLATFPSFPGCFVKARPIGTLFMKDEAGVDTKIIAVPVSKIDPRFKGVHDITDISHHYKQEIKEFFRSYKTLEPGKWVKIRGFGSKKQALKIIREAQQRLIDQE